MCAKFEVTKAFIEEVQDDLLVALQGTTSCLQGGTEIMRRMMGKNEIKQGFTSQSVMTLDHVMLIGTGCGEDILQCSMHE